MSEDGHLVLEAMLLAGHLIVDRGYDSTWFREALEARGIEPCIRHRRAARCPSLRPSRHKVKNLFAKLKERWRTARYDRCAHIFWCIAAAGIFRL